MGKRKLSAKHFSEYHFSAGLNGGCGLIEMQPGRKIPLSHFQMNVIRWISPTDMLNSWRMAYRSQLPLGERPSWILKEHFGFSGGGGGGGVMFAMNTCNHNLHVHYLN